MGEGAYKGKKRERERRRFWRKRDVQVCDLGGDVLDDLMLRVSSSGSSSLSDHDSRPSSSRTTRGLESSSSLSLSSMLVFSLPFIAVVSPLDIGSRGKMMKKLISMMIGRKADAKMVFLLLSPRDVVATA